MDGTAAIERNREALKRIVAMLSAMAGLVPDSEAASSARSTLPRHLWLAVLRLLRPAEAAARRLIIAAARGLVVPPPLPRPPALQGVSGRFAEGKSVVPLARWKAGERRVGAEHRAPGPKGGDGGVGMAPPARIALPLFDPLRRIGPHAPAPRGLPRICVPGWTERRPVPIRLAPSPDDPVGAARLRQRIAALAAALDDLPRHARRFVRWKARLDAEGVQPGRFRRISPLRGGPPPGGRLARYEPDAAHRRRREIREIDEILAHAHDLAVDALARPDTS